MQHLKVKLAFLVAIFTILSVMLGTRIYATDDNKKFETIQLSNGDYSIYIENNLDTNFEFGFSTSKDTEPVTYIAAANDGTYNVAFINSSTESTFAGKPEYLWVRTSANNYLIKGEKVELDNVLTVEQIDYIQNLTKNIEVALGKKVVTDDEIDGKKITVTVGKIEILEEGNYQYQIIKVPESGEYKDFFSLAERISKFNNSVDMYTKLVTYKEFGTLYNSLYGKLVQEDWKNVENKEIIQPDNAETGDEYVIWINKDNSTIDVQFLTSEKTYEEQKIVEQVTTILPDTYDDNTLLIILALLIIATVIVSIRIKSLKNKQEK